MDFSRRFLQAAGGRPGATQNSMQKAHMKSTDLGLFMDLWAISGRAYLTKGYYDQDSEMPQAQVHPKGCS